MERILRIVRERNTEQQQRAMDLQIVIEKGLFDLLHRIAEDYELDYEEMCERYMSAPAPVQAKKAASRARTSSPPPTCRGRTAKGQPCKKKAADGCDGYCKTHAPKDDAESGDENEGPVMCRARTAKGQPCKKKAAEGGYCKTHAPKVELESESEDEPAICKGMTGKKQPCKKKAADGCDGYCKTHKDSGPFKLNPVHTHEPEEVSEDCEACSVYGDPVNSPPARREYTIVRRSDRLKAKWADEVEEEGDDDMAAYAEALAAEMKEQGILDEIDE